MIYIYVGIIVCILAAIVDANRNIINFGRFPVEIINNVIFFVIFFILFILAGLRYNVGTDYLTYSRLQIPEVLSGINYRVEILYRWIIYAGNSLGDWQWIFILTHFIIVFFICLYIKKQSSLYFISYFILIFGTFYNYSLNAMRQAIAITIFLYATKYIKNNNFAKYVVLIIIAGLFHKSGFFYLPVYFLKDLSIDKKINRIGIVGIFIGAYILAAPIRNIISIILTKINIYSNYFGSTLDNDAFRTMYALFFILNVFTSIVCLCVYSKNKDLKIDITIQILATFISSIAFVIPNAFRVIYMFSSIQITLVPNILMKIKNKILRLLLIVLFLSVYLLIFYVFIVKHNWNGTLPYQIAKDFLGK